MLSSSVITLCSIHWHGSQIGVGAFLHLLVTVWNSTEAKNIGSISNIIIALRSLYNKFLVGDDYAIARFYHSPVELPEHLTPNLCPMQLSSPMQTTIDTPTAESGERGEPKALNCTVSMMNTEANIHISHISPMRNRNQQKGKSHPNDRQRKRTPQHPSSSPTYPTTTMILIETPPNLDVQSFTSGAFHTM